MRRCRSPWLSLVVVLALLVSAHSNLVRHCDRCPVDCPMHAQGHGKHLGCHAGGSHATAPSDDADGCALRSGCGTSPATTSDSSIPAVLVVARGVAPALARHAVVPSHAVRPERAAPEPAPDPPRPAFA